MARRKDNIVYHNMRMNLDNEQHRRIHMVLTDLNTNVHKSVNQFLIDATDSYIKKLEGNELTNEKKPQSGECLYITRDDLDRLRQEIKDELQKEMIFLFGAALSKDKVIQIPDLQLMKELNVKSEDSTGTEEDEADETTIGLASSWG